VGLKRLDQLIKRAGRMSDCVERSHKCGWVTWSELDAQKRLIHN
jgi:hypothetical protein